MPARSARWTMDVEGREKGSSLYWVLKVAVPRTRGVRTFDGGDRAILILYSLLQPEKLSWKTRRLAWKGRRKG